jgi:hypothetical protein
VDNSRDETPGSAERDAYAPPDAVVIGTIESLTKGAEFLNQPGDFTSQID